MIQTLICIDRDGTLIRDEKPHLFLGRDNDWISKVQVLPGVIEGLKKLKTLPETRTYMITNQPGVAITDFPLLTLERAHEVCSYVIQKLNQMGAEISGYFLCPHASLEYVSSNPGIHFDPKFIQDCTCFKPGLGMVFDALSAEKIRPDNTRIYVIGDRATDVATALNIDGAGILIPFENEPGEIEKTRKLDGQNNIFIVRDMVEAAELIISKEIP